MIQEHIFITTEKQVIRVRIADILFVDCYKRKSRIFCTDDVWTVHMSLAQLQKQLPAKMFVRIHFSYFVVIAHITSYKNGIVYLGDLELPIQYGKIGHFKAALNILISEPRIRSKKISH